MAFGDTARYQRTMSHRSLFAILLLAALALVAAACSDSDIKPTAPPVDGAPNAQAGAALCRTAGCVACHGNEARGTVAGPDIHGHTADQVRLQVRTPVGTMPSYDTAAISDAGLEDIAAFIGAIDADDGHAHEHTH